MRAVDVPTWRGNSWFPRVYMIHEVVFFVRLSQSTILSYIGGYYVQFCTYIMFGKNVQFKAAEVPISIFGYAFSE